MSFAATARFNDFRPNRTEEGPGVVANDSEHSMEPDETGIVGNSPALQNALAQARIVAPTDSTVVIYGETGTGKELFARLLHKLSGRRHRPFVGVNCAAIPEGLLESELFGHERGAFTGAVTQRIGRFEAADKGTLFLDEIGDLPLGLQAKLLRVLQEQEFERLGSTRTVRVDVRVVAATNQNLAQLIDDQRFRSDLFYRLHVFPIALPPLRERREDIPPLVRHCVNNAANRVQRPITSIPVEAMQAMMGYDWPGNIRELQNFIDCAVILSEDGVLRIPQLGPKETNTEIRQAAVTLRDREREHIQWTLERTGWVIGGADGAAARLGLPRTTLIAKMKRLATPQRGKRFAAEESKNPYATTELGRRGDIARD
jgi:formate hydrogenlyase transcriptional activator